jgi:hypothetical protein
VHGGGAFIWPVIQDYQYLDLKPLSIEANLTNAYHVKTFVWMFLVVLQLLFRPKQYEYRRTFIRTFARANSRTSKRYSFGQLRLVT